MTLSTALITILIGVLTTIISHLILDHIRSLRDHSSASQKSPSANDDTDNSLESLELHELKNKYSEITEE